MRLMTIQKFPNREIRISLCQQPPVKQVSFKTQDKTNKDLEECSTPFLSYVQNSKRLSGKDSSGIPESQLRPGYGGLPRTQRFSTYARRQILRAGGALESAHPYSECLFLTLTLPGSTPSALEALARYSAFAVQRFKAWLGKRLSNNLSIYTWEWQRRGALHLHYVVHCPDREKGEYIRRNLKQEWIRILSAISTRSGVDLFAQHKGFSWSHNKEVTKTDAQWCEKSVAAYLSKYVSKAGSSNERTPKNAFCPSRWYGVSRPLLQLLREMSFSVRLDYLRSQQALAWYEDCLSLLEAWSVKCYEYSHRVGIGKTLVSYASAEDSNSLWMTLMTTIFPNQNYCSNTELNLRRLTRNGCILIKRHLTWLNTFMQFNGRSYGVKLLNSVSTRDLSRADLIYLVDALAYSFRYTQRTRFELPGECKLWYSQMKSCIENAQEQDLEWIGSLKL